MDSTDRPRGEATGPVPTTRFPATGPAGPLPAAIRRAPLGAALALGAAFAFLPLLGGCSGASGVRDGEVVRDDGLYRLSDDTRATFSLTSASLDSVQLVLDGAVAYEAVTSSLDRSGRVAGGSPQMAEQLRVLRRRAEIGPGTPGVLAGGDFSGADWSYLDVDFGGVEVRFEAGYGGQWLDGDERRRPVLYFAPAEEIEIGGLVYRLDRQTYTGAALAFRGVYRYEETTDRETWVVEGQTLGDPAGEVRVVSEASASAEPASVGPMRSGSRSQ